MKENNSGLEEVESTSKNQKQLTSSISIPKGGGALRGLGEKFTTNPVTGTGSFSVPIFTSPGRSGFGPQLALSYDSGSGNGPFGLGWNLSIPSITRKTDNGIPRYRDQEESDTFILSGAEDLVPVLVKNANGNWIAETIPNRTEGTQEYQIRRYRPRIEGLFARIERWTDINTGETHWRSISKDNITTIYGKTTNSRIARYSEQEGSATLTEDKDHIFSWLICESYDDKGNAIVYRYKEENSEGIQLAFANEKNRTPATRMTNRYLKHIKYGNKTPRKKGEDLTTRTDWLFEVIFDYGEHYAEDKQDPPTITVSFEEKNQWPIRQDPFSRYRSGFEVRTYRLCQHVLMFHHFPDELKADNYLVRSTDFTYDEQSISSFIKEITQSGYILKIGETYQKKSFPPIKIEYSPRTIHGDIKEVDAKSLENLPVGLDLSNYHWVDIDGEGLSGILTEQGGAWYYKRNLSANPVEKIDGELVTEAHFGPLEKVSSIPSLADTRSGTQQFLDLAGDGQLDLVHFENSQSGFFERTEDEKLKPFVPFSSIPNISWNDPNLKFVDLTGDGHTDVLITEDQVFTWYPSLSEEGFAKAEKVRQALDEEKGPRLVFADSTQSVYLADMSGDGMMDLVRIRNGEVCYWPNIGYGRFGPKVTMDNSPWFDNPDIFDRRRMHFADIDGSGVTDIIYIGSKGIDFYFNQSGNSWRDKQSLKSFPHVDNLSSVTVVDLLGNGTACLVWSSPLPGNVRKPMRYVDLMGGNKPHLLTSLSNNMGAKTEIEYAPSTKFYLQDKLAGKPWMTKIPFPVHVVERVKTFDLISKNLFVTRYAYHHGYFDGIEQEFRGFGMVEQFDTEKFATLSNSDSMPDAENIDQESHVPPVLTKTWFHTGVYVGHHVSDFFAGLVDGNDRGEYYREPAWRDNDDEARKHLLDDTVLPVELTVEEEREGCRALKGSMLRQEIYALDGTDKEQHPYTVTEQNFAIKKLQPRDNNQYAVFFTHNLEAINYHYERNPNDPRVFHNFILEIDDFGNVLKSCSVVYGRRIADSLLPLEVSRDQQKMHIMYSEVDYTPDIDKEIPTQVYRLRVPYESRGYEITGIKPASGLFKLAEIKQQISGAVDIPYETLVAGVTPQKRLLSHNRTLFSDNNLDHLSLGHWDTLGLVYETYLLAFTTSVISTYYAGKVTDADFIAAGYVHFNGDANWWMPSGTAIYPTNASDHFYIPIGTKDPLGMEKITYFDQYDLLIEKTQVKQAMWNSVLATNDYRILGPAMITDPNKNRSAIEMDELGMVIKSAIMSNVGTGEGDTLADPTVKIEYELSNWINNQKPNFVHMFTREQHGASNPRWQENYVYSNGSGGVSLVKAQAHPGKAFKVNSEGIVVEVDANPRWVGNGRTVLNNKGKPIKQYEPYFSTTYEYEDENALREIGVTPILHYDPLGRNIRTIFPNNTLTKVEFNPWMQKVFDANDAVKESKWYADRGSPDPATHSEPVNDPERRAAWLAAKHANTPGTVHFDSLGRQIYSVSDYSSKTATIRSESDLTGRFSKLFDQEQREIASGFRNMTGTPIYGESAEKGGRWTFQNVLGILVKTWDEHGREFGVECDSLHRPVSIFVQESGHAKILFNYIVYGDRNPNAQQLNMLGIAHQIFDQAGMVQVLELDFKGNPKTVERILAKDYKNNLDWDTLAKQSSYADIQISASLSLDATEVFTATSTYDALNRPTRVTLPDGTVIMPTFNEANFLASLQAQIQGQGPFIDFLREQDYDAKGQRQFAHYGNGIFSRYFYDSKTFRLTNLLTYKSDDNHNTNELQNLHYTYDPVGNITYIRDDAQQTHFFNNAVVKPECLFEYDAIYQLILATGREHAGLTNDTIRDHNDLEFVPHLPHPNNATAVRTYTEEYEYDLLGNIKTLRHQFKTQSGVGNGWKRMYRYAYEDDSTNRTNQLSSTKLPGDSNSGPYGATYGYDVYGNMTNMPHLANLSWNFMDQLRKVDLGGGGTAYYVYGIGGQRHRKVIERLGTPRIERIYLGAVEIYREKLGNNPPHLERYTVHISDNTRRIAQVDTKTKDDNNSDPANQLDVPLIRYQYSNHLDSTILETNADGIVISYEEYHPYGTSAYRSSSQKFNLSLKRYRFSGKERDDETGLCYFGARYYAAWLGRWTSTDPAGFVEGTNLFRYSINNPITLKDPLGLAPVDPNNVTVIQQQNFTGKESFSDLQALPIPEGYKLDPEITKENFRDYYVPGGGKEGAGGTWVVLVPEGQIDSAFGAEGTEESLLTEPSEATPSVSDSSSQPSSSPPAAPTPESRSEQAGLAPIPDAARATLQEIVRPASVTGGRPSGTLHLWSGQGKAEARTAIQRNRSGWMMGDIKGAPTPQHATAELEFTAAKARSPTGQITKAEMDKIWGWRSASVVGRGALAGHPVEGHGPTSKVFGQPGYVQGKWEGPARAIGGGIGGGLFFGSGMFTAITGGQDPNPAVAVPLVISGVGEATSGIIYGSGAIVGDAAAMGIGASGATAFGGAGALIGFGVASWRSFEKDDTTGGIVNFLGAIGGALMIASLFTPVGWVGLLGVGLVAFAGGFNLGRWLSN